ncbi:hypothetical protein C1645_417056 [Glomus cerebriforme]|uniref:WD40-repeat-containing domain protein n=1 Tax=Glomus cerebriforme TaxID=658196 RepID=A0A397SP20_9GLOM|nr:hypothetical protein C1645_417056 [Glomus cerebriforme]
MEEYEDKKYSLIQTTPSPNTNYDDMDIDTTIEMISLEYSSLPFRQVIDVATFSPNGEHIATYAAKEGKLVIWKITNREGILFEEEETVISRIEPIWHSNQNTTDLKPRDYWQHRESFASSFTQKLKMTNIDFALSNDGTHVALSLIKLPQDIEDPIPFEMVHPPPNKATKFFTYIVKTTRDRPIFRRYLMKLTGTIKFTKDSKSFVICNIEHNNFISPADEINFIYVISTDNWKIRHKLVVDNFSDTLQVIPHPWSQINTVKNSLLPGHFIFVEQWDTALLWSLSTGQLVSRFKCVQKDSFLDADASPTLFALSHNQQMLATWTSKGVLTIFLCEGGLIFASSLQNNGKIDESLAYLNRLEILWLEDDEHILTISSKGTDSTENCVQIWDIYTCEPVSKFDNIKSSCLFDPNGKNTYITFKDDLPQLHKIQTPKSFQIQHIISGLKQQMVIGKHHYLESGFNRIYQYDSKKLLYDSSQSESILPDDHPIVELRIEPWLIYTPIKSGFCLDPNMERVLFIGHYTIQIWIFKNGEKPRLQFIWCRPMKGLLQGRYTPPSKMSLFEKVVMIGTC